MDGVGMSSLNALIHDANYIHTLGLGNEFQWNFILLASLVLWYNM